MAVETLVAQPPQEKVDEKDHNETDVFSGNLGNAP